MANLRVFPMIALLLPLALSGHAEEVATKDLRHASASGTPSAQPEPRSEMPTGCETRNVGYADGAILSKVPRVIKLDFVSFSDETLIIGNEITATLKLQNAGRESIVIPWSTDSGTAQKGQNPDNLTWETGQFRVSLRNTKNEYIEIQDTSQLLYGSRFVPGSMLTIKPGEWITAQITFRVAEKYPQHDRIEEGTAGLTIEWLQTGWEHGVKGCEESFGYFPYDSWGGRTNRVTVKSVEIKRPEEAPKPTE